MAPTDESLILRGPPDRPADALGVTLADALAKALRSHGDRVALVHAETGESLTFAQLLARSERLADRLRALGVRSGEPIGVCSENNLEFAIVVLGALFAGAAFAPVNPSYTIGELTHCLSVSRPGIVFCSPLTASRIEQVRANSNFVRHVIVLGKASEHGHVTLERLLGPGPAVAPSRSTSASPRPAAVLCSSGTTGLPKGVTLSDSNILTCLGHMTDDRFSSYSLDDVTLSVLPFFHAYGCVSLLGFLCAGVKAILLPRFQEELFLRAIQEHKVSILILVPPLMVFLAKHPLVDRFDLSSLRVVGCGAAPLSDQLQERVKQRLRIDEVRQGYGMTETTLGVLRTPPGHAKSGSSGVLAPGVECKVVDPETGRALGAHERGELCFRGSMVMAGYYNDPKATAACTDSEGFLRTGDVGYYDQDGFFFVVDRLKELIKYKAFQVAPAELEAVLLTHPAVRDAAVVGLPDAEAGELPAAFVALQPGVNATEKELQAFVADRVSSSKRLRGGVRFLEAVPKTPSGKILRRELRQLLKSHL